jgi:A/G-specific adenine glycosylase
MSDQVTSPTPPSPPDRASASSTTSVRTGAGSDAGGAVAIDEPMIATGAIDWFDHNARDLPWRKPAAGPWGVLVSEIMLQQTPVSRVLPAYEAWLARWPTPAALAADEPAEAIRAWGRLGYPRRALRLHACATVIAERHDGTVPDDVALLAALPGIGTYTAHAVATFAYQQRHPVVDTNVRRFVARVDAGEADGGVATTPADLWATEALLPLAPTRAARASAAFMEIGALICTARAPRCAVCPVADRCQWRAAGSPTAAGPTRRRQTYAGTDRQIRGRLLAILRDATDPVPTAALDAAWPDPARRAGALASLLDDGLAVEIVSGHYALGGTRWSVSDQSQSNG